MAKDETLKVSIVISRCSRERSCFGIRFEQTRQGMWRATWAFPIKERAARREGYETELRGGFEFNKRFYPGCPYCGSPSIFKCGCGKIGCWDGESRMVTCPWCGTKAALNGYIKELGGSGDG